MSTLNSSFDQQSRRAAELLSQLGVEVSGAAVDSRQIRPGDLFMAYPGHHADGRKYIGSAIEAGATGVIWEKSGFEWQHGVLPNLALDDLRGWAGWLAAAAYGAPSTQMTVVGVTGTNGKTSVSHWLAQTLTALGQPAGVIGTLGNQFGASAIASDNTTPDAATIQRLLAAFRQRGARAATMEVSSIGLDQQRVNGVRFALAVFTNLTRDHLEYHGDMEHYGAAKGQLFEMSGVGASLLNHDDDFGRRTVARLLQAELPAWSYGFDAPDHAQRAYLGRELKLSAEGVHFLLDHPHGTIEVQAPVLGRFNASNVLAVAAGLLQLGHQPADIAHVLLELRPVRGRMEQLGGGAKPLVVVDFAHTPDALAQVLQTLRPLTAGRLICVFGCGGNRDRGKRPLMAAVVEALADRLVITSDNPRDEEPAAIIADMLTGLRQPGQALVEADRVSAIVHAVTQAQSGDIVLIAGKGHEDYQEIKSQRLPFDDKAVATKALGTMT